MVKLEPNQAQDIEHETFRGRKMRVWNRTQKILFVSYTPKGIEIMEG